MLIIFLCIASGITLGYFLRKSKITKYIGRSISIIIILLLFFLGISVGINDQVTSNFGNIGFDAFIIATAATLGSILCAWIVYRRYFQNNDKHL